MVALSTVAIFFFLLVMVYPALCAVLAADAWYRKRRARGKAKERQIIADIETRTDKLKAIAFRLSILLLFFAAAPFLAIWLFTNFF